MTYLDRIRESNEVYRSSTDIGQLQGEAVKLQALLKEEMLNGDNRRRAQGLLVCVQLKADLLAYMEEGYEPEPYRRLSERLKNNRALLNAEEYPNTVRLLDAAERLVSCINEFMYDANEQARRVQDGNGHVTTASETLLNDVRAAFCRKAEAADRLESAESAFGKDAAFLPDPVRQVRCDIAEVLALTERALHDLCMRQTEAFFRANAKPLSAEEGAPSYDYQPPFFEDERVTAGTIVVCSPLRDEIVLLARCLETRDKTPFVVIQAAGFAGQSDASIDRIFSAMEGKNCLIFGLAAYTDANRPDLFVRILRYGKRGGKALLADERGDRALYDALYDTAREQPDLTGLDVTYCYLTLPGFGAVTRALQDKGMITPADFDWLKKNAAFMGYVGWNTAVSLFTQKRDWRDAAAEISTGHEAASQAYLKRIPSQIQLLDTAWRVLDTDAEDRSAARREFDYDAIRAADPHNVAKILGADITLFAKCGLAARYCTLHGDDVSIWNRLSSAEKADRLTDASRMVAHLLQTQYAPEVELVAEDDWDEPRAGGLCCDGGKLIRYRESACRDYDWVVDAVCHECFHSFQHTLISSCWQPWHFTDLGVTKNRIGEWAYNTEHYRGIGKTYINYRVQIMEADAFAFGADCFQQSGNAHQTIDWE